MVLTIVQLMNSSVYAYILPLEIILAKTAELAGSSIIAVKQDVIFKEDDKEFIVKEEWLIEGDKNLRVTATGVGELAGLFNIHYLYNNKKRTQIIGKNKVVTETTREFFNKLLATKSVDSYRAHLGELGISSKIRLSRACGAVAFAIGEVSGGTVSDGDSTRSLPPQIWIDQDSFRLSKIRFPNNRQDEVEAEAVVEFSDYKEYGKEYETVHYPSTSVVNWAHKTAVIKVKDVSIQPKDSIKNFYPKALEVSSEILLQDKAAVGEKIADFYKRFR